MDHDDRPRTVRGNAATRRRREGETFVIAASLVPRPATGDPDGDGIWDMGGFRVWIDFDVACGPVALREVVAAPAGDVN